MREERPSTDPDRHPAEIAATGDVLPLYLREIGHVGLLNGKQEVELAQAMERGQEAPDRSV